MEAYQLRVMEELRELEAKRVALGAVTNGPKMMVIANEEQELSRMQNAVMTGYALVLIQRTDYFERGPINPPGGEA